VVVLAIPKVTLPAPSIIVATIFGQWSLLMSHALTTTVEGLVGSALPSW
jgi:ABC-type nitrate/sulfonate/bicarbonate transport system permease component